jgi:hypothetical protein
LLIPLENDPGERFDVTKEHPEVLADIQNELAKHPKNLVPGNPQY